MSTIPILNAGLLGMQRAMNDAQRNGGKIAAAVRYETQRPVELTTPMLGLMLDRQQAQASARIIKTADELMGTIIDIMA